jgi:SAM-dependent methyltransferase
MSVELEHWQTIQKMLRGYRIAHILITCTQLDLFRHLARKPQTAAELAPQVEAHAQALGRLLDAAVAVGLLTKEDDTYANTPLARTCLAQEGPYYLGNLVRREGAFYQRWSYLGQAVRTGQRPEANIHDEDQTNWVLDFELALLDLARVAGPVIAEVLALPGDRPLRILDVGGGHGGYSMALARRYPKLEAVVYELPAAAEVARDIIAQHEMSDRVSVQVGDFQKEELGKDYDLVLLFGVLVSETPEGKLALLRKTWTALRPSGLIAIRAFWPDANLARSAETPIFSLQMLLSTAAGDIETLAQIQAWLIAAGFEQPHLIDLPEWLGSGLLIAHKPKEV